MSVAILSIGTELTRGEVINSNAAWLGDAVSTLGVEVAIHEVIPDDIDVIVATLSQLSTRVTTILCTGGLGPTTDDLTSEAVAKFLAVPMVRDADSEAHIRQRYAKHGFTPSESNFKQADFPRGATILPNAWGTAPAFSIGIGAATGYFFPGVPVEMRRLAEKYALPNLAADTEGHIATDYLQVFGIPESQLNDNLEGIEQEFGVTIGYRASFPKAEVKTLARRPSASDAKVAAAAAADAIARRLGSLVFHRGQKTLAAAVGDILMERGLSLGLAESCTGGLISSLITAQPCSDYFRGAIVCYDNQLKHDLLQVQESTIADHGVVSSAVVREMATSARRVLQCDVAIAVSGIAGPSGGTESKPVGLVHWGVATPDAVQTNQRVFHGDRERIQRWAAFSALDSLRLMLTNK